MQKYEKILLFSAGVDSYVAWHYLNYPQTLYVNIGSRYQEKEVGAILRLIDSTRIDYSLYLGDQEVGEKAYIPFRNLYLAMLATKYSDQVVIAGLKDDLVSDKNERVFAKWSELLSEMEGRPITVSSPFWQMTKEQVISWYLRAGHSAKRLAETVSCYSSLPGECHRCPACFRKWNAFWNNGIKLEFDNMELMQEYYTVALKGEKYVPERNLSIIRAVEEYRREKGR